MHAILDICGERLARCINIKASDRLSGRSSLLAELDGLRCSGHDSLGMWYVPAHHPPRSEHITSYRLYDTAARHCRANVCAVPLFRLDIEGLCWQVVHHQRNLLCLLVQAPRSDLCSGVYPARGDLSTEPMSTMGETIETGSDAANYARIKQNVPVEASSRDVTSAGAASFGGAGDVTNTGNGDAIIGVVTPAPRIRHNNSLPSAFRDGHSPGWSLSGLLDSRNNSRCVVSDGVRTWCTAVPVGWRVSAH